ncbi:non-ribosomal peptide synthetase [Bacillus wiedmannii]|uniref:non-ribosomal peptide synthetase n=1 Tax=Bacillus wiedmannii TaxID=1890302 RepID=UPI000D091161|nr:non-ribosomal peptide synthetase [Bacillus wiedmannii]PRT07964.1 non-ribosomal peptide synthetase [Bacillus wiedmannii]
MTSTKLSLLLSEKKRAVLDAVLKEDSLGGVTQKIPKRENPLKAEMSFSQMRLWFVEQFQQKNTAYNVPMALHIKGSLKVEVLEQSLNEIIQRHEALRTTITLEDGEPVQNINQDFHITMISSDLKGMSNDNQWEKIYEEVNKPFCLTNNPLIRVNLFTVGEEEHILLFVMHHMIIDGWSMGIIIKELEQLYSSYSQGKPSPLKNLPIQFGDFSEWQRNQIENGNMNHQLEYWKKQLSGAPALLELPTDLPRPTVQTFNGASHKFTISKYLVEKINNLSKQEGATLFMSLLGAFQIFLGRYSRQEDVCVGTPIANRTNSDLEELVGYFANTLVLRGDLSENITFREFLKQTRDMSLDAFANQDIPFEKLVEVLKPERDSSYSPLFQVMFVLQNSFNLQSELTEFSTSYEVLDSKASKVDLTLTFTPNQDGLVGVLEYNTDLFKSETILQMTKCYVTLLENILKNPDEKIWSLSLLQESEQKALINDWNSNLKDYTCNQPLHVLFEQQVKLTPDAIAVVFENQRLTYSELNSRSNQLAHFLQKNNVKSETKVGIYLERSMEMVISILGILKAGGAYVPIDPAYPQDRITYMLEDSKIPLLISKGSNVSGLPEHNSRLIQVDNDWSLIAQESEENTINNVTPDNLAYIIYTSGSTGKPKGTLVEHGNVVRLFKSTEKWYNFSNQDVWSMFHSFAFDFSVWELWGALLYGGRLVVVPYMVSRSPEAFYELLCNEAVTVLNQTPSAFRQLMQEDEKYAGDKLSLRYVIFGGEALDLASLKPWYERHGDQKPLLVNMYGITETTVHVTYRPLSWADVRNPQGSIIGIPIPDLSVYVLDQNLKPVPDGISGEMYVGGAGVTRGYLNRLDLNKERFITNPYSSDANSRLYKSGDLARYTMNGELEYLGRIDQQVKIRGFRMEIGEIESVISAFPTIREVVLTVHEDENHDKRLVAYIVPLINQEISINELRSFMKQTLPDYMIPSVFIKLDTLPLTTNGKVDRKALPAPDTSNFMVESGQVAPRNTLEMELVGIWENILNISPIGVTDNFFDLGGHSVLAVKLMSLIERKFNKKLPISVLFEGQTIEYLAQLISGNDDFMPTSPLVAINAKGSLPPIYIVHPAMGQVMCFADLARELGSNQPVYGLQSAGLYGEREPFSCLEEMAAYYIEAIKKHQPKGPYLIGGYCVGGTVAYEMAYQLQKQGETVDTLAIMDICPPSVNPELDDAYMVWFFGDTLLNSFNMKLEQLSIEELRNMNDEGHLQYLMDLCKRANIVNADFTNEQMESWLRTWKSTLCAVNGYQAKMAPLPITFFEAVDGEYDGMDWSRHTSEKVEVVQVDGDHFTMLRDPHVSSLAKGLQKTLEKVSSKVIN